MLKSNNCVSKIDVVNVMMYYSIMIRIKFQIYEGILNAETVFF